MLNSWTSSYCGSRYLSDKCLNFFCGCGLPAETAYPLDVKTVVKVLGRQRQNLRSTAHGGGFAASREDIVGDSLT
jgi:hypothetical protein